MPLASAMASHAVALPYCSAATWKMSMSTAKPCIILSRDPSKRDVMKNVSQIQSKMLVLTPASAERLRNTCRVWFDFAQWFLVVVLIGYVGVSSSNHVVLGIGVLLFTMWCSTLLYSIAELIEWLIPNPFRKRFPVANYRIIIIVLLSAFSLWFGARAVPYIGHLIDQFAIVQWPTATKCQ